MKKVINKKSLIYNPISLKIHKPIFITIITIILDNEQQFGAIRSLQTENHWFPRAGWTSELQFHPTNKIMREYTRQFPGSRHFGKKDVNLTNKECSSE
jgi:hypothetical protein